MDVDFLSARKPLRERALTKLERHAFAIASSIYVVTYAVMMTLVLRGSVQSIPYGVYKAAGARWLSSQNLYETQTIDGFQYLPTSAWLFSGLALLGSPLAECAWRVLSLGLYATGLWRLSKRIMPARASACFLVATCLSIGPAGNNLGNGQANVLLCALGLHVAADLVLQRWWYASATLAFGLALKPLMVVLLLLVVALYRPARWRTALALLVVFGTPWLLRDPIWLAHQYAVCWSKLRMCAAPDRQFEDIRGLLFSLGISLSSEEYLVIRAIAAVCVFAIAWRARPSASEPMSSFVLCALAANYLVLFNPRTLSTSYVMTAAFAGLLAARNGLRSQYRGAIVLTVIAMIWNLSGNFAGSSKYWLKPLAGILLLGVLAQTALTLRSPALTE